jgi:hypothetical protein
MMHDALLMEQVVYQAYDDDLKGVYRCFRALRGMTQSPWVLNRYQTYDSQFTGHRYRKLYCDVKLLPHAIG